MPEGCFVLRLWENLLPENNSDIERSITGGQVLPSPSALMKKYFRFRLQHLTCQSIGIAFFAASIIGVSGCEKEEVKLTCFECVMTYSTGLSAGMQYPCSTDIAQWQKEQKDNNGQPITSVCKEK
jgi:hypothetical protein